MAKQRPLQTIRTGRGIKASVWENQSGNGTWHNVTVTRTYQDKDGQLQDTTSFNRDDLPFVEKAAAAAFDYLRQLKDTASREADSEGTA